MESSGLLENDNISIFHTFFPSYQIVFCYLVNKNMVQKDYDLTPITTDPSNEFCLESKNGCFLSVFIVENMLS